MSQLATRRISSGSYTYAAIAALIALLLFPGVGQAAQVGAVPDLTWGIPRSDVDRTIARMKEAGIDSVRMNASWAAIEEKGKGKWNTGALADLDYAVDKTRQAGIHILMPMSDHIPYWASGDPSKFQNAAGTRWNRSYRPARMADYADYARFIVERYSARGVHAYEVWNEPNLSRFWPSGPSASEYVSMLKAAYPAIKGADPSATVVLGGLSKSDYNFLEKLYEAGARPYFDVAAVHPYTGRAEPTACWKQGGTSKLAYDAFCAIEEVRRTMVAHGDADKQLWLTEFGWPTYSGPWGVSEAQQADYLVKALRKLESYGYVKRAYVYNFRNVYWLNDDPNEMEAGFGLLRSDFSPKPAFAAVKKYATSGSGGSGEDASPSSGRTSTPRKRRSSTRLRLRGKAVMTQRGLTSPTRLRGKVASPEKGSVVLRFARYRPHLKAWRRGPRIRVRIASTNTFSAPIPRWLQAGKWRVRARFEGDRQFLRSRSPLRYFAR